MGSAWGTLGIGIAGALLGGFIGGPFGASIGYLIGSITGSYLFAEDYSNPKPKAVDGYNLQKSAKGVPVPIVYGTTEVAGNIIWLSEIESYYIKHESGGGKGGQDQPATYELFYRASFFIAVCEGVSSIARCWKGKEEVNIYSFTRFNGDGNDGLADLIGEDYSDYKTICGAFFEDYELGPTPTLPNFTFEVNAAPTGAITFGITYGSKTVMLLNGYGYQLGAGPLTNEGANLTGIPCSFPPFVAGDRIRIQNSSTLTDTNGYVIDSVENDMIIIQKAYAAEVLDGDEIAIEQWLNVITDASGGDPCVVGNYLYIPTTKTGVNAPITRVDLTTKTEELTWSGSPPQAYGGSEQGKNCKASPDGLYVYLLTQNGTDARVYKFRISDGVCMYQYIHDDIPGLDSDVTYSLCVDKDEMAYVAGMENPGTGTPRLVRLESDGSGVDTYYPYNAGVCGDVISFTLLDVDYQYVLACTGEVSVGATIFTYPITIIDTELSDMAQYAFYNNDALIVQCKWFGLDREWMLDNPDAIGVTFYVIEGDTKTIHRMRLEITQGLLGLEYAIDSVANHTMPYIGSFWFGVDGNVWVARNKDTAYAGTEYIVILDRDTLEEVRTIETPKFWGAAFTAVGWADVATNFDMGSLAYDEYPPAVIKALLTEKRRGLGLPLSALNTDTFDDEIAYCREKDIKISVAVDEQKPIIDWIQYICMHFLGYLYESNGKICCGSMRSMSGTFTITQDDLIREGDTPPVAIKQRDYSETFNRVEAVWSDRESRYRPTPFPVFDEVDQRISGIVRHRTVDLTGFKTPERAGLIAWLTLINSNYRFKTYTFVLGYRFISIEVGDVGTLTDGHLISNQTIRIVSMRLSKDGRNIAVTAVEDISSLYPDISISALQSLREADPVVTLVDGTVAFKETTDGNLELSIAPGNVKTNGWFIYRSYDGVTYDMVGKSSIASVTGGEANATGTTQSNLEAHASVIHCQNESFVVSIGTVTDLASASDEAFFNGRSLAKIGDEIIAYKTVEETATAGIWIVSDLIRGLHNTVPEAHTSGETFSTLDTSFTYELLDSDTGKTLYFKVVAFYGTTVQTLADVSAFTYTVQGSEARPNPASLARLVSDENTAPVYTYSGASFTLYWNLPGADGTGFNEGGFDLNTTYPLWRYGDSESELIGGNGVPYGNYLADPLLQNIDLVFEQTDGTFINQRSVSSTSSSATIVKATDLGGLTTAVVKIYPRRTQRALEPAEITVTGV